MSEPEVQQVELAVQARWRRRLLPASYWEQPQVVRSLSLIGFFVALGYGIVAPALPLFAHSFGVGRQAAGAVISIFAIMRLVSAPGGGRLANAYGERRILAVGILIVAVSSLLCGFAQSYLQLFILRGAGGIGSAMFTVSASALLLRAVPAEGRGQANGAFVGGFLIGGISGPALGGLVTDISPRAPFFIYTVTLAFAAWTGLRRLPRLEQVTKAADVGGDELTLREALRMRSYRVALVTLLSDNLSVQGVRNALLPLFVVESLHDKPYWTGIGFLLVALVNAATLFPAGKWSDTHGRKPPMVLGLFTCSAGFGLLAVWPSLPGFLISSAIVGFGSGLLDVSPSAVIGDIAAGRKAGGPIAAGQMAGDLGSVTGPLAGGRLADSFGFTAAFVMSTSVLAAAGLYSITMRETRKTA